MDLPTRVRSRRSHERSDEVDPNPARASSGTERVLDNLSVCSRGALRRTSLPGWAPRRDRAAAQYRRRHPDYLEDRSGRAAEESPSGNPFPLRKPKLGWLLRVEFALGCPSIKKTRSSTAAVEKPVEKIRVNAPNFCCVGVYSKMHTCAAL